jgi:DNA-binding SARP family transcriptional activator
MDSAGGFRVEVLGPVEAWVDGRQVALGGQRPRALLAALALTRGRVVTSERLVDELWGEDPPARARDSLQMHVSRLRKALTQAGGDADRLASQAGGYVLELGPGACDVDRWEAALVRARRARATGLLETARVGIDEALGLWRGAPLGGVSANGLLEGERARLEEERLAATIEGIELDLELGRHGEILGQLEALVAVHPFAERLVELQMLALYRCGRQADALEAFQAARTRLVDELGIEPGQLLRELHGDVLRHADALGAEPAPPSRAPNAGCPCRRTARSVARTISTRSANGWAQAPSDCSR